MKFKAGFKGQIALGLVCVLIVSYTVYHLVSIFGEDISTYAAGVTTERTSFSYKGYIFRDEKVLVSDNDGIVEYLVQDGTKVAQDQELAVVYGKGREKQKYVSLIDRYIRVLEESRDKASLNADIVAQKAENADSYDAIIKMLARGETGGLSYQADKLLVGLNAEKAITNGGSSYFDDALDIMYEERQRIFDDAGDGDKCSASTPGYFFSGSDGCEEVFTMSAAEELTVQSFSEMLSYVEEPRRIEGAYGRLTKDSEWRIVLVAERSDLKYFEVGNTYSALFSENNSTDMPLYLERIVEGGDQKIGLLVFSCDRQPENFSFDRCQSVSITVEEVSGIYVPKSVVVREDGVKGVYILRGSIVYFRHIDVIYEGSDYYLVRKDREHDGEKLYIRENDMIILNGQNMFDGRVLD